MIKTTTKKRYLEVSTILEYTPIYYGKGNRASSRHQFLGFSWHGVEDCFKMLTWLDHNVPADIWAVSLLFFHIPGEVSSWWHGVLLSNHYKTGKHINMAINGWIWSGAVLRNNTVWPSSDDRLILRGPVFTVVCKQCISVLKALKLLCCSCALSYPDIREKLLLLTSKLSKQHEWLF